MEFHPAANAFPMMDDSRFADLVQDIRHNGQREEITVFDGMVLDGRNRYRACEELDIVPKTREFRGDPWQYAWSLNGNRRDLNEMQRAAIKLKIDRSREEWIAEQEATAKAIQDEANRKRAEAAKVQHEVSNPRAGEVMVCVPKEHAPESEPPKSYQDRPGRAARAAAANVSSATQAKAEWIANKRPDLLDKVATGEIKASAAILEMKKTELEKQVKQNIEVKSQGRKPLVCKMDAIEWLSKITPADLLLTDPPYSTDIEDVNAFAASWLPLALSKVKSTGRAYVFVGAYPEELQAYFNAAMPTQVLVWTYRNTLGPTPLMKYKLNWQAILYYQMPDAPKLNCPVMLEHFSVQDINAPDGRQGDRYHAWQKPLDLAERLIRHSTKEGDTVIDPFCCTGTFPIAAAGLGRLGLGCDISDEHLDIAQQRGCERG